LDLTKSFISSIIVLVSLMINWEANVYGQDLKYKFSRTPQHQEFI